MTARILLLDIETKPITAHIWSLRDLHVGINQIVDQPRVIGVGYGWHGKPGVKYADATGPLGYDEELAFDMLCEVHAALDEADVLVTWNGDRFDVGWLNAEFIRVGLTPPSPYKSLDLYKVARKHFSRLPSLKLQYFSTYLGLEGKHDTGGHSLWMRVLDGDPKARSKMARYCRQDTRLLGDLLEKMRPWLPATINFALLDGHEELHCSKCSSDNLESRGVAWTATAGYPQYRCRDCGGWTRDRRSVTTTRGSGVA